MHVLSVKKIVLYILCHADRGTAFGRLPLNYQCFLLCHRDLRLILSPAPCTMQVARCYSLDSADILPFHIASLSLNIRERANTPLSGSILEAL